MKTIFFTLCVLVNYCLAKDPTRINLMRYEEDLEDMFEAEDIDGDGFVTLEEFKIAYEEYRNLGVDVGTPEENMELFNKLDKNNDGALDRAEYGEMVDH